MRGPPLFPVVVGGASARTPLGLSARQTALCARAKKGEPRSGRYRNHHGYPIGTSTTPGVPERLEGIARLAALAAPALRALARGSAFTQEERRGAPVPLILAVPESGRPDDDPLLGGGILAQIAAAAELPIDGTRSQTIRAGHAGFALALSAAVDLLSARPGVVIVGAVDSYHHEGLLAWLDGERRIHGVGVENGFVPGEGAAFLTLRREGPAALAPRDGAARVRLASVETHVETSLETGAPNTALALTQLLAALAPLCPGGKIPWILTDVNGERHRVREHTFAAMRGSLAADYVHSTYSNELGDIGAASGAVLAAIAHELLLCGGAPARTACVTVASDGSARGAFLLSMGETAHD